MSVIYIISFPTISSGLPNKRLFAYFFFVIVLPNPSHIIPDLHYHVEESF